jgi:hypothetical protein
MDYIRVFEGGGNTEFRSETLRVLLMSLLWTTTEFLDGIELFN